jgi:hypothetical protein
MKNLSKLLNKFGGDVVKDSKKNLDRRHSNSSGKLKKSISHKIKQDEKGIELGVFMEDYGVLLDAGQLGHNRKILKGWNKSIFIPRGKGFTNKYPKVDAIKKWIRQKPITSTLNPKSLAFLISRKIYREGITPRLFMSDAYNKHYKKFDDSVLNATDKDIEDKLD